MATPSSTLEQIYAGGLLYANPTSNTSPYGGTVLGRLVDLALRPTFRTEAITAEEYGGEASDLLLLSEEWVLTAALVDWDADALARIFPNVTTGGSGEPLIQWPGGDYVPGSRLSGLAARLMLVPDDAGNANREVPGFVLQNAIPVPEESAPIRFGDGETIVLATWLGIRDSSGRVVGIGAQGDVSIS